MTSSSQRFQENGQPFSSASKLKVTILASEWGSSKGGLSTINREIAIQLAKFPEVQISFFVPQCSEEDKRAALSHNIEIVQATRRPGYDELEWLSFPPDQLQIDVVVGHGAKLGHQAQVIIESHQCKWIQVVHTDPEELGMFKSYENPISTGEKKHITEVELCEMADFVVGVGPKLCEAFRRYLRWCKKDQTILEITPGVLKEFVDIEHVGEERKRCEVLVFGRGDAEDFELKGFDIAGKAIARLKDVRLIFVGAPAGKHEEIAERFLNCGITANSLTVRTFVQNRESLKRLFCEVDLVLMPSRTEGFGLTGLEALSAGVPVLVSKNSGFGEALSELAFGASCVIDSEDSKVWAKAIKKVWKKGREMRLQEAEVLRGAYDKKYNWVTQSKSFVTKMISIVNDSSVHQQRSARRKYEPSDSSITQATKKMKLANDDHNGAVSIIHELQQIQCNAGTAQKIDLSTDLQKNAADRGFDICDNPGSGNCMFYALSQQLQSVKGINIFHRELRKDLVQFLETYPNLSDGTELFNFVHGYPSWSDYLRGMEKDGTWGDHVILHAAANCYKTCIRVISSLGHDVMISPGHPTVTNINPLVLGHIHEKHYVSLQPRQGTAAIVNTSEPTEVIERIRQLYKTREERLLPVPWCDDFSFHLNEIFTKLRIVGKDKTRGELTDDITDMTAIFKPHEECEKPRTVLIEGDPGMGKTTYCQKLAYDWATKQENWDESFPTITILLLLRCHDIKSSIWEAIDEQILPDDIDEESKENFFKFVRENQSKVLLVLDGLDEADQSKLGMYINLAQSRELPKCHVVFTSRHESGMRVRRYCDTLWEIVGFTRKDAKRFIRKYFKNKKHLAGRLLKEISHSSRSDLRELTTNPLNTTLLCILCEDFKEAFPTRKAELYIEIVQCVLRRYEKKNEFSSDNEDLIEVYKEDLKCLGRMALTSLIKGELYIEESKFTDVNSNVLTKFGFLSIQFGGSRRKPCSRYGFLHKSFQEFFAGLYLALKIVTGETDMDIAVTDERFLTELKQVFLFMTGIVVFQSEESAMHLLRAITKHINSLDSRKEINRIAKLAFSFIKECSKCKESLLSQLLHEFGSHLALLPSILKNNRYLEFILESLSDNTILTKLNLRKYAFGDSVAASLSKALSVNNTLTNLNLSFNWISASGAAFLSEALFVNTTLTNLHLKGNTISDSGAASLSEALSANTALTYLDLNNNDIGDSGAGPLSEALSVNSTLTNLDLSGNAIGDSGTVSLSEALLDNTTLTHLNLGGNKIGACDAAFLAEALSSNTTLTNLDLGGNRIGGYGAASLSGAIAHNAALTNLNLSFNAIGDSGAASLSEALLVNKTLTNLNLSFNGIGDSGAASLSEALSVNNTLTILKLYGNMFSDSLKASFIDSRLSLSPSDDEASSSDDSSYSDDSRSSDDTLSRDDVSSSGDTHSSDDDDRHSSDNDDRHSNDEDDSHSSDDNDRHSNDDDDRHSSDDNDRHSSDDDDRHSSDDDDSYESSFIDDSSPKNDSDSS